MGTLGRAQDGGSPRGGGDGEVAGGGGEGKGEGEAGAASGASGSPWPVNGAGGGVGIKDLLESPEISKSPENPAPPKKRHKFPFF